jgi:hypothetical protein
VIFKEGNASGIFGLGRDFYDYFRKGIFSSGFFLLWGSMSKNLKNSPSMRWNFFS